MRNHLILLSVCLLCVSACSTGGNTTTPGSSAALLPPEPDRAANNATLAGIDTTGTGVRDDVHRLIFNTYTSTVKRKISMAIAKEMRGIYSKPPQTTAEARAIADAESLATDCMWSRKDIRIDDKIKSIRLLVSAHADTKERMKAYLNYNHLLNGEGFDLKWNEHSCDAVLK